MGNTSGVKRHFKTLLLISIACLFQKVSASNVAGGDITWKCIGKDSFLITTTIYRVCDGLSIPPASIALNGSSCTSRTVALKAVNEYNVVDACRSVVTKCKNPKSTFAYGMKAHEFQAVVNVSDFRSGGCCDISVSYNKCCRYSSLTNMNAKTNNNLYLESTLNICQKTCNDAEFKSPPRTMAPLGRDISIDFGLIPWLSSDSTIYSFEDPAISSTIGASWAPLYGATKPVTFLGFPRESLPFPRGFHIEKSTGIVSFRPMREEVTLIKVRAKIYRSGILIGSVAREQLLTVYKSSNSVPTISGLNESGYFSAEVCPNQKSTFFIYSRDQNGLDSTFLSYKTNLTGATITHVASGKKDALKIEWTPAISDTSRTDLAISLVVKDNSCPINQSSLRTFSFKVKEVADAQGQYVRTDLNCDEYQFALEKNGLANIKWYVNDSLVAGVKDFYYQMKDTGTYVIKRVTNHCKLDSMTDTLRVLHLNNLKIGKTIPSFACEWDTLSLGTTNFTGNHGPVSYAWRIDENFEVNFGPNDEPVFKIWFDSLNTQTTKYVYLTLTDSAQCSAESFFQVRPLPFKQDNFFKDIELCTGERYFNLNSVADPDQWFYGESVKGKKAFTSLMKTGRNSVYSKKRDNNFCYFDSAYIDLRISPVVDAGSDFEICRSREPIELSPAPNGGRWIAYVGKDNYFNPATSAPGSYLLYYSFFDTLLSCTGYDSLTATVTAAMPQLEIPDTIAYCDNESDQMVFGKPLGGTWTGNLISPTNDSFLAKPGEFNGPRFKFFYAFEDQEGCKNEDTMVVLIQKSPKASFTIKNPIFQKKEIIPIQNNTSGNGPTSYQWLIGEPYFLSIEGETPSFSIDSIGEHNIKLIATDDETQCKDSFTLETLIRITASQSEMGALSHVSIWPNPSKGPLFVANNTKQSIRINVLSVQGQKVLSLDCSSGLSSHRIDELNKGVYLLQVPELGTVLPNPLILE